MFFSVFSCFSACRNKSVILAFLGLFGRLPCFTSLLCLLWPAVCLVCVSSGCGFLSRGALSVSGVALGPARLRLPVGCAVSVAVCLSRCLAPSGRLRVSNRCSICPFVQVFRTGVRRWFLGISLSEFLTESDRIWTESSLSVEPNLDRISESLSLSVQPNPNRISKSNQDFILSAACSLGERCRIYELALVDC